MTPQSIWFDAAALPQLPRLPPEGTLSHHLGMRIERFEPDALVVSMPVDGRTRQVTGLLHGGASIALAETAMSAAASYTIDRSRFGVVGLEINGNHVRAVREGVVWGTARPVHLGRSTQVWTCEVRDEQQRLVCSARMTVSVLEKAA